MSLSTLDSPTRPVHPRGMVEPDVVQALRTGPFAVAFDVAVEASGLTLERLAARLAERGFPLSRPTLSY